MGELGRVGAYAHTNPQVREDGTVQSRIVQLMYTTYVDTVLSAHRTSANSVLPGGLGVAATQGNLNGKKTLAAFLPARVFHPS